MNENRNERASAFDGRVLTVAALALLFSSGSVMANPTGDSDVQGVKIEQQSSSITGSVRDANGEPIIGANILVKGTTTGTLTDYDGNFSINCRPGSTLVISFLGYKTVEVRASRGMSVVLQEDVELLDEVVVVGYGTQKKANLTGAVSSVDVSKTLESKSTTDLAKALQGSVPGLTILNANGGINEDASIVIRGIGTLSNNGISTPLYVVDGVPVENLNYLNTNDIESISVLKDAASTSIYGTRAAFGVVLVTTKSAKTSDRVKVSYTNNFGWSQATTLPDYPDVPTQVQALIDDNYRQGNAAELFGMYMDEDHFQEMIKKWAQNHKGKAGYREMIKGDDYDEYGYYADWDVQKIMFNNATPSQNHTLSVQGNSGKTNYYLSLGYNKQQGVLNFNPDTVDKYNATVNVSTQATSWMQVGARVSYSNKQYEYPYMRSGTYQYLWRWGSFFGPYGYFINPEDGKQYEGRTMIGYRKTGGDSFEKTINSRIGGFLKIDILKGLTFNADYTYTERHTKYKGVGLPAEIYNTWSVNPQLTVLSTTTFIETSSSETINHVANAYFNYQNTFAKNHNLNLMVGGNLDKTNYEYLYYERHGIQDLNLPELALASEDYSYTHRHTHQGSVGYFGRINYDYKGIYLLELNGRFDGSSKFPKADQWAFFPSASIGYRISEEPYFAGAKKYISNLKLRASYGEIGNQEVGSNMFLETMSKQTNNVNWLGSGSSKYDNFSQPKLVSSSLTWETIATTNIGIDLGFLNNELNVNFDWFQRDTRDMLAPGKALPSVLGASAAYENAGSLRSRGWEITVDWRHSFGDVNVYATANLSDYTAKITEWDSNNLLNTYYTGKEYGEIWGFETDRYFDFSDFNADGTYASGVADQTKLQSGKFVYGPGDIKFVDQNKDGVIDWGKGTPDDHGDLIKIGNSTPRYQYSLRLGGEWKGFDLDIYMQGVGKRDMWTQSAFVMPMMRGADALYSNQTSYVTEAEYSDGKIDQSKDFPRMWSGGAGLGNISSNVISNGRYNFYPQTKYLVNMAYLRMKNITLGYTLPRDLTRKITIDRIRVYVAVNNAFDIINHNNGTGLDPEINTGVGSYANGVWGRTDPILRTYSFGIQVDL